MVVLYGVGLGYCEGCGGLSVCEGGCYILSLVPLKREMREKWGRRKEERGGGGGGARGREGYDSPVCGDATCPRWRGGRISNPKPYQLTPLKTVRYITVSSVNVSPTHVSLYHQLLSTSTKVLGRSNTPEPINRGRYNLIRRSHQRQKSPTQ